MNREQEAKLTEAIKEEMTSLRNNSIVTGMKSAIGVILNMCNNDNWTTEQKLKEIRLFCERSLKGESK